MTIKIKRKEVKYLGKPVCKPKKSNRLFEWKGNRKFDPRFRKDKSYHSKNFEDD